MTDSSASKTSATCRLDNAVFSAISDNSCVFVMATVRRSRSRQPRVPGPPDRGIMRAKVRDRFTHLPRRECWQELRASPRPPAGKTCCNHQRQSSRPNTAAHPTRDDESGGLRLNCPPYGAEPGVKAYSHVSDRFSPFATQTIPATVHEAPYILDGLLMNETGRRVREQYADTDDFTDHVFAACSST